MAKFKVLHAAVSRMVDGNFLVHRAGEIVDLPAAEVGRLVDLKAVAPVDAAGEVTALPEPGPVSPHIENALEDPADVPAGLVDAPLPEPAETPRGNASLEEWTVFAKANGATDEELAGKTRDDIRAMFTPDQGVTA